MGWNRFPSRGPPRLPPQRRHGLRTLALSVLLRPARHRLHVPACGSGARNPRPARARSRAAGLRFPDRVHRGCGPGDGRVHDRPFCAAPSGPGDRQRRPSPGADHRWRPRRDRPGGPAWLAHHRGARGWHRLRQQLANRHLGCEQELHAGWRCTTSMWATRRTSSPSTRRRGAALPMRFSSLDAMRVVCRDMRSISWAAAPPAPSCSRDSGAGRRRRWRRSAPASPSPTSSPAAWRRMANRPGAALAPSAC